MITYIARRILFAIPVLFTVALLTFVALAVIPGDPARIILGQDATPEAVEALRTELGLDRPILVQFFDFLAHAVMGDLGRSYQTNREVSAELARVIPASAVLALAASVIAVILGITLGVLAAAFHNSWFDKLVQVVVLASFSIPVFWMGLLLILYFSLTLDWFPTSGFNSWSALVLPAVTLSMWSMAAILRMTRSSLIDVMTEDFIRVARSRGIGPLRLYGVHALRPALNPVITILGLQVGSLLTGAVLTEVVFNWPGMGRLMIISVFERDYPMIRGVVLAAAVVFIVVNIITDIAYSYADPRVRHAHE